MTRDGIVHLDGCSSKIFSSFGAFVRLDFYALGLLSYGAFVHFGSSLSAHMTGMMRILIVHTCIMITWPEIWSYTLMVGVVKYFHLLGVLSALIFMLWGCCPMVLLSIMAFLCPPTWPHDENVDRPHLYHVITWPEMKSYTLMVWVVKYFHLLGVLSALIFMLCCCCPMVLLSILALLCPPTWPAWWECWSSTPLSCDHMTRDGIVHLDGWSSKIFSSFGGFVRLDFLCFGAVVLWCFCPFWLFSVRPHDRHDENIDRPHLYHDHMTRDLIVHLDGWSSKIFSSFGGFVRLDFYALGLLSSGAFVHYGFSLSAHVTAWRECWSSTPVSCDHMTRDGIVHLDGWSSKIFSSFGGFVRLDFYALGLLSFGAFVHYGFSLSAHVTAWRECWSSTAVSCDHMTRDGIVHLDGWSSKIFSSFGGFVRLDFYPLGLLSYGAFVHFGSSLSAHMTGMMGMLIVHTCIMWWHDQRWDRTPWWLE